MITSLDGDDKTRLGDDVVNVEKCVFKRGICVTHNCDTRSFKVSVQKWQWIERKKKYGFVSSKVTKYICLNLVKVKTASLSVEVGRLSEENISQQQREVMVEVERLTNEKILSQQQRAVNNGTLGGNERESLVFNEPASMTGMCSNDYHNQT